jgi:DNA-binding transcriptional MerR regulator
LQFGIAPPVFAASAFFDTFSKLNNYASMAQSQIAFDFDDLGPAKVVKPAKPKKVVKAAPVVIPPVKKAKSTQGRKSIKEAAAGVALVNVPPDEELFKKMYYSIGDVADMFKLKPSLIRLWENEFDALKPKKNGKGDRHFRPEDVKTLQLIFHLLREKKYTMEGAKDFIKNNSRSAEKFAMVEELKKIKAFLHELKASL